MPYLAETLGRFQGQFAVVAAEALHAVQFLAHAIEQIEYGFASAG